MYKDIFSCSDKVALVTGGCGLIGKEISSALADFGAKVYIADINQKEYHLLMKKNDGLKFVRMDIGSAPSVRKAFLKIALKENRLDILVNCAYPRTADWQDIFEDIRFESWRANLNNHLGGYFLCCQQAAEMMRKRRSGSIINIASIYGMTAPDFGLYKGTNKTMPAAYAAIKAGVIGLSRYLATYYAKYNIRSNVISPGGVFDRQDPGFVRKYKKRVPLAKMAEPQDIAAAVVFLASRASKYITGINLPVDGGWTAW